MTFWSPANPNTSIVTQAHARRDKGPDVILTFPRNGLSTGQGHDETTSSSRVQDSKISHVHAWLAFRGPGSRS